MLYLYVQELNSEYSVGLRESGEDYYLDFIYKPESKNPKAINKLKNPKSNFLISNGEELYEYYYRVLFTMLSKVK